MKYWSFLLQCCLLLFVVGVFSLCTVMPCSLDAFSPMDNNVRTTQQAITEANTPANEQANAQANAEANEQANAEANAQALTNVGPAAVPVVNLINLVDMTGGIIEASQQKLDDLQKKIEVEAQWIKKYDDDLATITTLVNQLNDDINKVNTSINVLETKSTTATKNTNSFRSRIQQVEDKLMRERNTAKNADLRNRRSDLRRKLSDAMKEETNIKQTMSPLIAQRERLTGELQQMQPKLTSSEQSRTEYNTRNNLLQQYRQAWDLMYAEHNELMIKTQKAQSCIMALSYAQPLLQLIQAILTMTPEQLVSLTNTRAKRISTLIQDFQQIDVAIATLTNIPRVNNVIGTGREGTKEGEGQQPELNRILINRMRKARIVIPEKITRLPTNVVSIRLEQIKNLASQSEMLNKTDPKLIQTQVKEDMNIPVLRVMVNMIPEKNLGSFYQQLCMFQSLVWHIRKNPLATKFDKIPIQPNLETASIFANSGSQTFTVVK